MVHKLTEREIKEEIKLVKKLGAMLDFQTNKVAQLEKEQTEMLEK